MKIAGVSRTIVVWRLEQTSYTGLKRPTAKGTSQVDLANFTIKANELPEGGVTNCEVKALCI